MAEATKIKSRHVEQQWDLVIEAGKTERHYWRELWRYRELLWFLAWRDILVRYKQTIFGVAWSIVRPVLAMVVFSVVFGKVAKLPSDGLPYPILVYSAMLPWQFFSSAFAAVSNSLVGESNLISKIYLPRLIIPISKTLVSFIDFIVAFLIYVCLMLYFHIHATWNLFALPLLLLFTFMTATGPGLLVASLNVRYRDFKYIVPFFVQFGLYISPVGFSSSVVPAKWRLIYSMNPMVGVIDGFRWALIGTADVNMPGLLLSIVLTSALCVAGVSYFRRTERAFADVI